VKNNVRPSGSGRGCFRKEKVVSLQAIHEIRLWLNREFNNGNLNTSDFTKMIKLLAAAEDKLKS
jgi:hypothetical protein